MIRRSSAVSIINTGSQFQPDEIMNNPYLDITFEPDGGEEAGQYLELWKPSAKLSRLENAAKGEYSYLLFSLSYAILPSNACVDLKYATMNVRSLVNYVRPDYFGYDVIKFSDTNGLAFLKAIQDNLQYEEDLCDSDSFFNMLAMFSTLNNMASMGENVHRNPDDAQCSNYLMEPAVLLQLPFDSAKFLQWLALAQNLVFSLELEMVEFVSGWPLDAKVADVYLQLLLMVRKLKQRVAFGFALIADMMDRYPGKDEKFPAMIMKEILLPCAPLISFFKDRGMLMLEQVKKQSWPFKKRSKDREELVTFSGSLLDPALDAVFSHCIFSNDYWENFQKQNCFFPPLEDNFEDLLERICEWESDEQTSACLKPFSLSEEDHRPDKEECPENFSLKESIKSIFELCVSSGMVKVDSKIKTAADLYLVLKDLPKEKLAPFSCIKKCARTLEILKKKQKKDIVMGVTEYVTQKHSLLQTKRRIALACKSLAEILKKNLVAVMKDGKIPPFDAEEIKSSIGTVKSQKVTKEDILKSGFSDVFATGILPNLPKFEVKDEHEDYLNEVANYFQIKIRTLVYKIMKDSLACLDNKFLEVYQDWDFIQYLLPTLIARFLTVKRAFGSKVSSSRIFRFLDELVGYYQEQVESHIVSNGTPTPPPTPNLLQLESKYSTFKICDCTGVNYGRLSSAYSIMAMRYEEFTRLMEWIGFGENCENIYHAPGLVKGDDYKWLKTSDSVGNFKTFKRLFWKINSELSENHRQQMESILNGFANSLEKFRDRIFVLLMLARRSFGLPPYGAVIPSNTRLSNLHQTLAILSEMKIFTEISLFHLWKDADIPVCFFYLAIMKFFHLWNSHLLGIDNPARFCMDKYHSGRYCNTMTDNAKVNPELHLLKLSEIFAQLRKRDMEVSKGHIPPYSVPIECGSLVRETVQQFMDGDVDAFLHTIRCLLFPSAEEEENAPKRKKVCAVCGLWEGYMGAKLKLCRMCRDDIDNTSVPKLWYCGKLCKKKAFKDGTHNALHDEYLISQLQI
ncbi:uncharacterized protein LOC132200988 isoform X2 [Neocloeon triangulifer]|uniref:uncharacterized protein LOC132200988 isoform X2 n=1 Tax=Neocloeon triangulifer TaxID=2078957 RepID=UPI00286ED4C3|nr:uncharacterized protein LOC132200988 isoform X2 [Neocloeon triangulifer]